MYFHTHTFENGIRIIHHQIPSRVAHCGLLINAGSRDELANEHGMAHFIEHVIFKGTKKRRAHHIINRLETVGGEINAYTGKEETCIYSSFMKEDFERSLELICDMTFHSVFPEKEMLREKEVIMDEIISYLDNPSEQIFDDFEEIVFNGNPISRNILGTPKFLKKFTREDVFKFMVNNYQTDQMVFSSAGDIGFKTVLKYAQKYLGSVPANKVPRSRIPLLDYKPSQKTLKKRTHQAHCIIGNLAFDLYDKRRMSMILLNNILGGPGMSARLNLALRERSGYAYNVESHFTSYSNTGVFTVYFGTDKVKLDRCRELVHREFCRLRSNRLSDIQLKRAKRQLTGQMTIGWENKENLMLAIGKSYLLFNRIDNMEEMYAKIDNVTSADIQDVADIVLDQQNLSELVYL
ncbi:MAG: M16 family metallopeptidase [Bacteroidales bacterium]